MKKSTLLREITEEEYHEHRRLDAQALSGHLMVFSFVAAAYLLLVAPRAAGVLANPPPAP